MAEKVYTRESKGMILCLAGEVQGLYCPYCCLVRMGIDFIALGIVTPVGSHSGYDTSYEVRRKVRKR
jgi:hypothetical protein